MNTTMTVRDVAAEIGYEDTKYFSKIFRNKYGVNPSGYREAVSE